MSRMTTNFPCSMCGSRNWPRKGAACPLCRSDEDGEPITPEDDGHLEECPSYKIICDNAESRHAENKNMSTFKIPIFEEERPLSITQEELDAFRNIIHPLYSQGEIRTDLHGKFVEPKPVSKL
jgi:hypothetical protein